MNQQAFGNPPPDTFLTVVNMIYGGVFHHAGQPRPLSELKEIPPRLRQDRYIVKHDPKASQADDSPASLNYTIGVQYDVDGNGLRRPKHIQREIIDLQLAQQQQELLEQHLSEPSEQEQMALAVVQADHDANVLLRSLKLSSRRRRTILPTSMPENL